MGLRGDLLRQLHALQGRALRPGQLSLGGGALGHPVQRDPPQRVVGAGDRGGTLEVGDPLARVLAQHGLDPVDDPEQGLPVGAQLTGVILLQALQQAGDPLGLVEASVDQNTPQLAAGVVDVRLLGWGRRRRRRCVVVFHYPLCNPKSSRASL